ncbi:MAG: T9SS type A sorting domain-containing protein [Bacteroidetes bacterium]|nr:T9SS type A sorting domain-containing protein [Bacteroidota bacterium]
MMKHIFSCRKLLFLVLMTAITLNVFAQNQKRNRISALVQNALLKNPQVEQVNLFAPVAHPMVLERAKDAQALAVNMTALQKAVSTASEMIQLNIPYNGTQVSLLMYKADLGDFIVTTKDASGEHAAAYNHGIHYRGIVLGNSNSIATASLFANELMIVFSDESGNHNLGRLEDGSGYYVVYNEMKFNGKNPFECFMDDRSDENEPIAPIEKYGNTMMLDCKTVKCYYEADFAMYNAFGSNVTTTSNYVTSIFNEKATLYANDNIPIEISQIVVWTVTDPYATFTSTSTANQAFITQTGSTFNGDIANLLTTRNLGGGIAQGFSGLCNKQQAHCTSMIYTTYSNFPTYSWTIMVITHEMGHLMGSRHTHACVWNGNNTAIDGCSGSTEGGCPLPGNPSGGGTIMSYCHFNVGINFNLGFGPQPGGLLLNNFNNATCLTGSTAGTPTGLNTSGITANAANLNWNAVNGATQYAVEYKTSSAPFFAPLGTYTSNTAPLNGLTANTSYDWRVNADCSPFSNPISFTTSALAGCDTAVGMYVTNLTSTSAKVNWSAYSAAVKYRIRYRASGTTTWTVKLTNNAFYVITGLSPLTTYQYQVGVRCGPTWKKYSKTKTFKTLSNVPPTNYCASNGSNQAYEYIDNVTIGAINNTSGNNAGYGDYTNLSTAVNSNSTYAISVGLFKASTTDIEYVSAWIDYNRDGDFDDAGELAYSANGTQNVFTGNILTPALANFGQTRMRVSMQFSSAPPTCGTFTYGEVEDYIIDLQSPAPRLLAESDVENDMPLISVVPNPANDIIQLISDVEYDALQIQILDIRGKVVLSQTVSTASNFINIASLAQGIYVVKISELEGENQILKFVKQ